MAATSIFTAPDQQVDAFGQATSVESAVISDPDIHRMAPVGGTDLAAALRGVVWWKVLVNAIGLYVVVLTLTLLFLTLAPTVVGFRPTVVISGSMSPALRTSDVVLLEGLDGTAPVGTVIEYQNADGNRIHRVVELTAVGYRTKGDANAVPDSAVVSPDDVNGIGVMAVPLIGLPVVWTERGEWPKVVLLVVTLVAAAWVAPHRWLVRQDAVSGRQRFRRA